MNYIDLMKYISSTTENLIEKNTAMESLTPEMEQPLPSIDELIGMLLEERKLFEHDKKRLSDIAIVWVIGFRHFKKLRSMKNAEGLYFIDYSDSNAKLLLGVPVILVDAQVVWLGRM